LSFRSEVSRARTFGFMKDVEFLWKRNLALGASLENTVALGEDRIINPEGLRYSDEFVRHKILDAVGDLALAGAPLLATYRAYCPGHKVNAMMLKQLFADRTAFSIVEVGQTDRASAHRRASGGREAFVAAYAPDRS
jgi:UDP-3-O-[3-hydroxymyristoyl] N-acetylglucosamine deacetylase